MKFTLNVAMAALISIGICVQTGKAAAPSQPGALTVCMSVDSAAQISATRAELIAGRMFARIGVALDWRGAGHNCPAEAIIVRLTTKTPGDLHPHALAYALPYECTHIRVFFDRIHELSRNSTDLERHLLAHVLVHEITHILQGTNVHSDRGLMKARWDQKDFDRMRSDGLAFTPQDIGLIRSGMAARAAHSASATMAGMEHYNWDISLFGRRP